MDLKEDLLEEAFLNELKKRYSIEECSVFAYGFNRMQLLNMKKGRIQLVPKENQLKSLGEFFINELHLSKNDNSQIQLDGTNFDTSFFLGTPFMNIMESMFFRATMFTDDLPQLIETNLKQALTLGKKKAAVYRKTAIRQEAVTYFCLLELNKIYEAEPTPVEPCGFLIDEEDYFSLMAEEALERQISSFKRGMQTRVKQHEKDVEDFLYRNLHLIEEGLCPLDRQVVLPNGRIDILARDIRGRDVIIEVKVEEDTDIVWQREYYVSEWEKHHFTPRFIVIIPTLKPHLKKALLKIGPTEFLTFETITHQDSIVEMRVEKPKGIKTHDECIQQIN